MTHTFRADANSLTITGPALPAGAALSVLFSGRRIWSFRIPAAVDGPPDKQVFTVHWPLALAGRLTGRAGISLELAGALVATEQEVRFDQADTEFQLLDPATGVPLVVNKWGRISASFAGQEAALIGEVLDETERLIALAKETLDLDLFVTGGTLLGPVRDGRIMPGDDDADLAYLSRFDNPSDLARENFNIERMLVAHGYEVVRLSAAHLQLMFPGGTVTDRFYIDIFTYFYSGGWFYGTFHAREPADRVTLLPLRPVLVDGRSMPGPANPAELLAAIYGEGWAVPDPAFTFVTPPAARRRYIGWFADLNMDRENWESHHRGAIIAGVSEEPSDFARATASLLDPQSTVVELGCGLSGDAAHLAGRGHDVLAIDYSRPAIAHARATWAGVEARLRHECVNLNATREVARLLQDVARLDRPVQVYARSLFDSLSPEGWEVALLFTKHVLNKEGSRAYFEFETGSRLARNWSEYGAVDWSHFERELRRHGLAVEDKEDRAADSAIAANEESSVTRVIVRRERA